jgi:hypothetical protein
MTALAEKVEALAGPCRETDAKIYVAVYITRGETGRPMDDVYEPAIDVPRYTASVDAVLALIAEKMPRVRCEIVGGLDYSSARIVTGWGARRRALTYTVDRPDNYAAICAVAAFLRAMENDNG